MGGSCPAWARAVLLWEVISQGNAKEKPGKAEHHTASCTASLSGAARQALTATR